MVIGLTPLTQFNKGKNHFQQPLTDKKIDTHKLVYPNNWSICMYNEYNLLHSINKPIIAQLSLHQQPTATES